MVWCLALCTRRIEHQPLQYDILSFTLKAEHPLHPVILFPDERVHQGAVVTWSVDIVGQIAPAPKFVVVVRVPRIRTLPCDPANVVGTWQDAVLILNADSRSYQKGNSANEVEAAHTEDGGVADKACLTISRYSSSILI